MMKLSDFAAAIGGTLVGNDTEVLSVGSDTRALSAGQLFVALRGEHFDGHTFLAQAAAGGAAAALIDAAHATDDLPLPCVVVPDTRLALGALAAWWRARFALPLIGITGSNGKTSVKEMCAAILRAQVRLDGGDESAVLATVGNLNNDIGLPLMLLRLRPAHRFAVIEMGMNHPGEIEYLTRIAQPTVALVNNAQRAHLAGMGGLDAVAIEKGAIYLGLTDAGVAVVNADDPHADLWRASNAQRTTVSFATERDADVRARAGLNPLDARVSLSTAQGNIDFTLHVPGAHNVRNAAAAAAATLAAGVSLAAVADGLGGYGGTKGRLQVRAGYAGATILDDTYNANPDSVRAGIDVLAMTPGRKVFVFGDMGEIGDRAAQYHDEVGGYAKSQGVDLLFALGEHAEVAARNFGEGGQHYGSAESLIAALRAALTPDTVVLVKGSRFMKMERIADAIALAG
ncbi:UDP-N-acetylmuramoyl-tripeptide--D-alanyl-D-alanine ligase [Niveibacterium sp. 24ML]|uniref:UDP-N-acetylmuramoyl-tripeptide--D-alanyl-D- alanine ligase n=1 Tax=Niveibacterium sp. 24ML TaxID=2985512 RepID=UPI00226F7ABB|nr:UDP-N-acetylmuramoyl-tripeptide--D-alanyl-D-alanine ligase [Niveibacterium sp. 24ML]MCX9157863.1 UDP-N-acetylmuramoyl-tripeptide--D-alanyl-D-alanine ligase [Niveibacterium sp. 24ML]